MTKEKSQPKETRTVYQIFADWLAKDATNPNAKYNVQWSDDGFLVKREPNTPKQ